MSSCVNHHDAGVVPQTAPLASEGGDVSNSTHELLYRLVVTGNAPHIKFLLDINAAETNLPLLVALGAS